MSHKPIYVTQPKLPELDDFMPYLEKIWHNKILTNGGPFHQELEDALANYLGVPYLSLFNNGTIALLTALQALDIKGEVITTPYSFVATAHSLLWHGIEPVFVDIDPHTFNLNPDKIVASITPKTTAIMPVHCYGTPCDTQAIEKIANQYHLRVIYDAAHAFGVSDQKGSILNHGDLSVLSFHATKVFNTFEGGAIISPNAETKRYIDQLKNFGFVDETTVCIAGINGKMSELNAAVGLLQLKTIQDAIAKRQAIDQRYRQALDHVAGIEMMPIPEHYQANYSYFPVLVTPHYPITRDQLYDLLRQNQIFARRYFYPLISEFPMYRHLVSSRPVNLPVASQIAQQVLCLPIFPDLDPSDQDRIIHWITHPTDSSSNPSSVNHTS